MPGLLMLLVWLLLPSAEAVQAPPAGKSLDQYGSPRPAELQSIAFGEGARHGDHVRTHGRIEVLVQGGHLALAEAGARLLLIPGHGLDPGDFRTLVGTRVEVRGIVRPLRPKQYSSGVDWDLIEDPALPPMPAPDPELPRVSLTVLGLMEVESQTGPGAAPPARGVLAQILSDPTRFAGKPLTVVAQFRGRNLFDDLPKDSARNRADWVVKDGDTATWVTGRAPRGKGYSLDPDYRGDTSRWLEVVGKPEVVNGVLYLRASSVKLAAAPKAAPDPP